MGQSKITGSFKFTSIISNKLEMNNEEWQNKHLDTHIVIIIYLRDSAKVYCTYIIVSKNITSQV